MNISAFRRIKFNINYNDKGDIKYERNGFFQFQIFFKK